jgi:hypothetical protein
MVVEKSFRQRNISQTTTKIFILKPLAVMRYGATSFGCKWPIKAAWVVNRDINHTQGFKPKPIFGFAGGLNSTAK